MNLPNPFNTPSKEQQSFVFLAILLTDTHLQSALVEISEGKIQTKETSSLKSYKGNDDGLKQADISLQELGTESENISQVVFGFDSNWIGSEGLIDAKKPFLKSFTEGLSLQPIGYVLLNEASIQNLMASSPLLSTVCLFLHASELNMFLIKQGKMADKITVGMSGDIIADTSEGLARLTKVVQKENQYLPAKMMLISSNFDQEFLVAQQQKMMSHDWTETFPFLQAPMIEILSSSFLISAVVSQGGAAVASKQGIILRKNNDSAESTPSSDFTEMAEEKIDFGYSEVKPAGLNSDSVSEIGENAENDISSERELLMSASDRKDLIINDNLSASDLDQSIASSFGVPIGSNKLPELSKYQNKEKPFELDEDSQNSGGFPTMGKKNFFKSLSHKKMIIIGMIFGLMTLSVLSYVSLFFISSAHLDVKLKTISVAKDVQITLDPNAKESDPKNLILSASVVEKELTDTDEYKTSGIKLVGEKAKGKITIFNKTDSVKTFESGTVFALNDQKFTLDEEIKVASSTVEIKNAGETKNYGQAEAQITAVEIGAEGNIGKDSELKIANFDLNTYSAKTNSELSGGSSREIRVVAEKDRIGLLQDLTKSIYEQSKTEFSEESGNGKYLVPIGGPQQKKIDFSAEVGDEVESLTLTLTIISQAISYSSDDLKPLAKEVLTSELPENYELLDENPEILTSPSQSTTDSAKTTLDANISAKAQPKITVEDIKNQILGKEISSAKSELESQKEIDSVSFKFWPFFAESLLRNLPKNNDKIQVEFQ